MSRDDEQNSIRSVLRRRLRICHHVARAGLRVTIDSLECTGWFAYFFATLLALVLPLASFVAYIAVAIYYLIPRGVDDDITDDDTASRD
jgi:hypothetical protein